MALSFEPITPERQGEYLERLQQSAWEASDYSFVNVWGWCREYDLSWAWDGDLVWFRQTRPETLFWGPVGPWERADWAGCFDRHFSSGDSFIRIPDRLLRIWEAVPGDRIRAEPADGHWDYLYSVPELIALKGNRFHKKKNLLNQFKKKYEYRYVPLTPEMTREALAMQEYWCTWRDCESAETLASENRVIARVLAAWEDLENLSGGAIFAEGKMVAFTVAEQMSAERVVIHFEKGLTEYKGVYQAINQMFLAANSQFRQVNREQDLGDEGLRKAKMSYNPVGFVRKYRVTLV
ncbi:DUF2156 domain-containing protein [Desulfonema ishimotonii]|uniref:DUF2156 domain-containing protein n=1 Tax=Desulfonema ishimotonii TaxID=45657 RepID=A0A401FWG9_9BACT|nr:phosphatidylglycerol lysyltransferase domain-containing protein [Desulfonema ishimotonii]GBC61317.1 DUF2156 domain-containing protein [Desulfonema ishimotonii]